MAYHKTIIKGNLGQTPELRQTNSGVPVTSFSVAVNESWTKDGVKQDKTTWYKVTCWRRLAEVCCQYLEKGREVLVEGTMEMPTIWTDKDGNPRADLNLTAKMVDFGARGNGSSGGNVQPDTQYNDETEIEASSADSYDGIPF
mgnify:CR=1 FL=1